MIKTNTEELRDDNDSSQSVVSEPQSKNKVVKTEDGSSTIYVPELNEHYHSIHGAEQESMHVFINAGLKFIDKTEISIFEVGFGTGLNAWLTLLNSEGLKIEYHSIEKYVVDKTMVKELDYFSSCDKMAKDSFTLMHDKAWNTKVLMNDGFVLNKIEADFKTYVHKDRYDLIYFDAFAPDMQENMWTQESFQRLYDALNENGVLVTYCAKGVIKRMLKSVGFTLDMIPGPPGKREMTRAIKK